MAIFKTQRLCEIGRHWSKLLRCTVSSAPKSKWPVPVIPHTVSEMLHVPETITRPPYAKKPVGIASLFSAGLRKNEEEIKDAGQIQGMRDACKLAAEILSLAGNEVIVGRTTDELDKIVHKACIERNCYPSPLLYRNFPKSCCTSVNNVACHGIPDDRPLAESDIINIDVTVFYNGFHGDCSRTFIVGETHNDVKKFVNVSKECLNKAISLCGPGIPLHNIGSCIQKLAHSHGYNIVPIFCGHGIGSYFHGYPDILHFENNSEGLMKPGMTFTIEPILSTGTSDVKILEDGWTAVTTDNSLTAQFEHTILVTDNGAEILTLC